MSQSRQLAAIMFTDIVGYTALMGDDEQKALTILNKNRGIQKPIIEQFNGRWIKELGDGILASFNTVSDAVNAAIRIQKTCNAAQDFQLRIGIHLGEIVFENNDVFGDGVNIASRIQAIATPGSIYISESVQHIVSNKKEITSRFIKEELLKNVKEVVRIYEVIIPIEFPNFTMHEQSEKSKQKSIAVLPFTDMSPAHDQEYLGDGLAAEMINILSQISELKVIGRTSSFSFKNKVVDLKTIGRTLDVKTILEGSIQKSVNRLRITAQLINAEDSSHIWSQRYDREMNDIFALQDDICSKIGEHLKLKLLHEHETAVENRPTKNLQAYELFLKGDFYYKQYTTAAFGKSIECFEGALKLDPDYADAWWYLGYLNFELHGWLSLSKDRLETALFCASKAISIDATNAYGHFLLALIYLCFGRDWEKVKIEIALGNKHIRSLFALKFFPFLPLEGWYRAMLYGDFAFAVRQLHKGLEHDPLNWYYQFHLAQIYLYGIHDYEKTRQILNSILELGFSESMAYRPMCLSYLFDKKYELAKTYAKKEFESSEGKGHGAANMIICLASLGEKEQANQLYNCIKESLQTPEFPFFLHAKVNAYLDHMNDAFDYLNKAITENEFCLFWLKYSPEWDLFRSDPRFQLVLERMNFPK